MAHFPAAAFAKRQHLDQLDPVLVDDDTNGDRFLLADLLENPGTAPRFAPVAYPHRGVTMPENFDDLGLRCLLQPQRFGCRRVSGKRPLHKPSPLPIHPPPPSHGVLGAGGFPANASSTNAPAS